MNRKIETYTHHTSEKENQKKHVDIFKISFNGYVRKRLYSILLHVGTYVRHVYLYLCVCVCAYWSDWLICIWLRVSLILQRESYRKLTICELDEKNEHKNKILFDANRMLNLIDASINK